MISRPDTPSLVPLKAMIWLYFILLLVEGALRKWILPDYSNVLLVVRDPVVLLIYGLALQARVFPFRPAVITLVTMAFFALLFSALNEAPPLVTLFGLRTNFLHPPLIFVMLQVLDRDDVLRFGRALLITAIPVFAIMLIQFQSSPSAWINVGAGGSDNGQIRGALGKIRPPGPFSFIDGLVAYFGLVSAFVYYGWIHSGAFGRKLLLLASVVTILAVPISISRSLLMAVLIVLTFGFLASLRDIKNASRLIWLLAFISVCLLLISQTVYMRAFTTRWDESISSGKGTFKDNILDRMLGDYSAPVQLLGNTPLLGHGIGVGTLAGSRLMTGKVSFLLAESELARIILELGPLLGMAFIGWRVWLALKLAIGGWHHFWESHDALSWLIGGTVFVGVLAGQWGSSTQLGFAVFGAGLALAARNEPPAETSLEAAESELTEEESANA